MMQSSGNDPRWSPAKRMAFRFAVTYFVLYVFFPDALWGDLVGWYGRDVLGLTGDLSAVPNGSGDRAFEWADFALTLPVSVAITALWSILDRRRLGYPRAARWLEVGARYYLGVTLLQYGTAKVIPAQFPLPPLDWLLTPFLDASPMGVVWRWMGVSPAYTIFSGLAEMAAGLLLIFKPTRTLGALLAAGVMTNVVVLNFAYDIPVKLFSSHLLLLAGIFVALDRERLMAVFLTNRPIHPIVRPPLFESRRLNLAARVIGTLLTLGLTTVMFVQSWEGYRTYGAGRERSELWGIWEVERFAADGEELPPLMTDPTRWRALVLSDEVEVRMGGETFPGRIAVQSMDGEIAYHNIQLDESRDMVVRIPTGARSLEEAAEESILVPDTLRYEFVDPGGLSISGRWYGRDIQVDLRYRDLADSELLGRGFRWVNDAPWNR